MEKHNGGTTLNARIKIDYTGKNPSVKFSFPNKKQQREGSMLVWIFIIYFIINLPALLYMSIQSEINAESSELFKSDSRNLSNYDEFLNFIEEEEIVQKAFIEINKPISQKLWESFKKSGLVPMIFVIQLFIMPFLIYLPFKKFWNNLYPDFMAFLSRKKQTEFKTKDVLVDGVGNYYCEIPLFNNILLDYNATGDFSKYLQWFEIREHNFKYIKRKRDVNDFLWYAKFYFSKKPITGKLEVKFK